MRSLLNDHIKEKEVHHQHLLIKTVSANSQQNSELVKAFQILEDQISNMEIRISNLEKDHDANSQRLDDLEEKTNKFQGQYTVRMNSLEKAFSSGSQPIPTITSSRGIETAIPPTLSSNDGQLLRRVPELFTKQEEISRAVEKLMSSSVDQELRIQLLEQATYNGVLVWKIDEVSRRMDEAVKGITVSLFSAPFYSDPRGYKMCARYDKPILMDLYNS